MLGWGDLSCSAEMTRMGRAMVRVLLVEDDPIIAQIISFYLDQEASYETTWAKSAGEAMAVAGEDFDVVLLDVLLPDVNGVDLCARLREWMGCPIIFISCLSNSETIINALEAGGDDFIVKPFDNKVLVAKIEANLRRSSAPTKELSNGRIACQSFVFDANRRMVMRDGREIRLSPQESLILLFFMQNAKKYLTAEEIYRNVWGRDSLGDTRSVPVHIHNIRKKIEINSGDCFFKNTWGRGYIFDPTGGHGEVCEADA